MLTATQRQPGLTEIVDLIRNRAGLTFNDTQSDRLDLAIRRMMTKNGIPSLAGYYHYILDGERPFTELVEQLTTNETYFYREPKQIELLVDILIPGIMKRKSPGERIKILSAGCSTGAEPYSLAIAVAEKYGLDAKHLFSITGFDIDTRSLAKAREGVFSRFAFRGLDPELQRRYFTAAGNHFFRIRPDIARMVRFRQANLVSETYPADFNPADLIFYRNVSIYFDQKKQRGVFQRLANLLENHGCLIMSATEVLSHDLNILNLKEIDGIFVFSKQDGAQPLPFSAFAERTSRDFLFPEVNSIPIPPPMDTVPRSAPSSPADQKHLLDDKKQAPPEPKHGPPDPDAIGTGIRKTLRAIQAKQYDHALDTIDTVLEHTPDSATACLLKAGILMQMNRIDQSRDMLHAAIRLDHFCIEGYLLLGFIAKLGGDMAGAIRKFREAVYIEPHCWPAHFHLAELHHHRGEIEAARREYRNVMKLMENGDPERELIFFNLMFTPEQIRHLCRHNLARLEPSTHRT